MREKQTTEAVRLVMAREAIKIAWESYAKGLPWPAHIEVVFDYPRMISALEVALDEIDCALLRLEGIDVDFSFELRDDNENDSQ